ncbi:MAG: DNA topoisomerase [Hornefia sp.]|nr:DNA topoisomerase [Hornefia sp.]
MRRFLIMTEKESVATAIVAALELSVEQTKDNIIYANKDECDYILTYTNGHCLELLEPHEIDLDFKKWNLETLPITFSDDRLKAINEKYSMYKNIVEELKICDVIINAGDAGREGELIQRWIIDRAFKNEKKPAMYRAWFQSLTKKSIQDAFDELIGVDYNEDEILNNLYNSGRARVIMDKYLGVNYSRCLTLTKAKDLTIVYGRCQTPLIHEIVSRDMEIENFQSEKFSYISVKLDDDIIPVLCDGKKKRIDFSADMQEKLLKIYSNIGNYIKAVDVASIKKKVTPPFLYDILSLQKEMSRLYGYEADETLNICERLYNTYHILSYPRTDSRYLTDDLKDESIKIFKNLKFGSFKEVVENIEKPFIPDKYFNNKKVIDHHALIPFIPDEGFEKVYRKLSFKEKRVLDSIIKSLISLFMENFVYERRELLLQDENNNLFFISKKRELEPGFRKLYQENKEELENDKYFNVKVDETFIIKDKKIVESKTKPKSRYTTATLLDFMKVNNIGTGATRHSILKEIVSKKGLNKTPYVSKDGKYFVSTKFGREVDDIIPEKLKSINYLNLCESNIKKIEEGTLNFAEFMDFMEKDYANDSKELIEKSASEKKIENVMDITCPICGKPLVKKTWGYACKSYMKDGKGCSFTLGFKYFDKTLSESTLQKIILTGRSNKLKFKNEQGKSYPAYLNLKIENGKVKLVKTYN